VPLLAVLIAVTAIVLVNIVLIVLSSKKKKLVSLDSEVWHSFKLIEMEGLSHDVIRFRFALHSNEHTLGLPIGQHISLKFVDVDGKEWQRSYTPTTSNEEVGYVDFVIKIYYKNVHPKFPEGLFLI
jgi:NAD(P)H-flavin reductase